MNPMANSPHYLTLQDGRKLTYAEYGDCQGTPLLFFHGTPGTHLIAQMAEEGAKKYGFRLIAPDRPGLGESDLQPQRQLYHYPLDIVQLLHALGLKQCGIVAISGGVPYALQCAHDLPEQIPFVVSLSGWVSYGRPEVKQVSIPKIFRFFHWCDQHCRLITALVGVGMRAGLQKKPDKMIKNFITTLPTADQKILAQEPYYTILRQDLQNAFAQGWRGPAQEGALQFAVPGYEFSSLRQPLLLLHGTADNIAPYAMVEVMKDHLPNVKELRRVEEGGHFCAITEQDWIYPAIRKLL